MSEYVYTILSGGEPDAGTALNTSSVGQISKLVSMIGSWRYIAFSCMDPYFPERPTNVNDEIWIGNITENEGKK